MRSRIIISLGVLLALCLLGDVIAIVSLDRNTAELVRLAESHRVQAMRMTLSTNAVMLQREQLKYFSGQSNGTAEHARSLNQFDRSLATCGRCHHEPEVQAKLDRIHVLLKDYKEASVTSSGAPPRSLGLEERKSAVDTLGLLVEHTSLISDQAMEHLTVYTTLVAESINHARYVLWATCGAALIFGGFVAIHLQRRLTRPVEALLNGIERVRKGDFSHRFSIDADKEFRSLGAAFNHAYEGLRKAQEGMLQAEKMAAVGKMAAGVAHEVGNPLASISSIAQLMRRRMESTEEKEQIDLIMSQIARISRIVRDLLTFSRPTTLKEHSAIQVEDLIEHAGTLLGYDKRARNIRIVQDFDKELGAVRGDPDRLLLVFTNVMINAFDAIEQHRNGDGGVLRICATHIGETVRVRFEDNGPGMTEEQIANAFEPFYTTKEPGQGTGLGLWICYQIISNHQGSIAVQSLSGEGTTVLIELPCDGEKADAGKIEVPTILSA